MRSSLNSQSSMKGWELYSFTEDGKNIKYALLVGTNRCKFPEEIRNAGVSYKKLLKGLKVLAKGERILWRNGVPRPCVSAGIAFEYPQKKTVADLEAACKRLGISLAIIE